MGYINRNDSNEGLQRINGYSRFAYGSYCDKSLTETFNNKLPKTNQINPTSTIIAAFIGFVIIGVDAIEGGFSSDFMGTKGLLTAFVVSLLSQTSIVSVSKTISL